MKNSVLTSQSFSEELEQDDTVRMCENYQTGGIREI